MKIVEEYVEEKIEEKIGEERSDIIKNMHENGIDNENISKLTGIKLSFVNEVLSK